MTLPTVDLPPGADSDVLSRTRLPQARARNAASWASPRVRVLLPVLHSLNAAPAVRHVIGESMRGERIEAHLLLLRDPLSRYVAQWLPASARAAFHRDAAEQALRPLQGSLARFHVPCAVHVEVVADRAAAIVAKARELRAKRIVLGAARDNTLTRLVEDAVIEKVIAQAAVPVDVVAAKSVSRIEQILLPVGLGAALGLLSLRLAD
jgi:nucleotide-binding universal stress UspA family protein